MTVETKTPRDRAAEKAARTLIELSRMDVGETFAALGAPAEVVDRHRDAAALTYAVQTLFKEFVRSRPAGRDPVATVDAVNHAMAATIAELFLVRSPPLEWPLILDALNGEAADAAQKAGLLNMIFGRDPKGEK
jgi:hypothetical protein